MTFPIGTKVCFKENCKGQYNSLEQYLGHQFIITGYMPDSGIEFNIDTGLVTPFNNPGVVTDHVRLECCTGLIKVDGYIHDWDLEEV